MAYTTIDKPSDYFETLTWTGNGSTPRTISGLDFAPNMIWSKRRDDAAGHNLLDIVRGAGANSELCPSSTGVEGANAAETYGYLSAFTSDGFTVTAGSSDNAYWNNNTATYVAWNWKAGGSASSNSNGSITSSVSANTTAGFSIVSYTGTASTGATVGHGLGVKPDMIITKARAISDNWGVYHKSLGATKGLYLNTTNAQITSSAYYNNTEPTSTLVTLGDNEATNDNDTMIMYAFAEKKGYSKFGSYTGNGNADGSFVYTGFKPAFVIVKSTDLSQSWQMSDNKRDSFNVVSNRLRPNESSAESTSPSWVDFNSQGFKFRHQDIAWNGSGNSYIYMAFAENPFVTSTGIPTTAR